jgi:hypothetical protein
MNSPGLFAENIWVEVTPYSDESRQYQYDQSDPFKVPGDKRFFLFGFHFAFILFKDKTKPLSFHS